MFLLGATSVAVVNVYLCYQPELRVLPLKQQPEQEHSDGQRQGVKYVPHSGVLHTRWWMLQVHPGNILGKPKPLVPKPVIERGSHRRAEDTPTKPAGATTKKGSLLLNGKAFFFFSLSDAPSDDNRAKSTSPRLGSARVTRLCAAAAAAH